MKDFDPPIELAVTFAAWRDAIGVAAYKTWMRGAKAWIGTDGAIHIKPATAMRARWIRMNYAGILEKIAACPVIIEAEDQTAPRNWPHNAPMPAKAWWQDNERWIGDRNI